MNVFEIIQKSWLLYRASFRQNYTLAFIMALTSQLALWIANMYITPTSDDVSIQSWPIVLGCLLIVWLVTLIGNAIIQINQNARLYQYLLSFNQSASYAIKRLAPLLLAAAIFSIMVSAGLMLFIVPGVLAMTFLALYSPAVLFLKKPALPALETSFQLVRKEFFAAFTILALNLALLLLPQLFTSTINLSFTDSFGVQEAMGVFATSLLIPFSNALILVLFYKLNALNKNPPK